MVTKIKDNNNEYKKQIISPNGQWIINKHITGCVRIQHDIII